VTEHHPPDHLGEKCEGCGTVHRVLDSIPDRALTPGAVEAIRESDGIEFVRGIAFVPDPGVDGGKGESTEDLVLSTSTSTMLLSRYRGTGWVVEQEIDHSPDEEPRQVGHELWAEASKDLTDEVERLLDDLGHEKQP
jgi:hypothetical protein